MNLPGSVITRTTLPAAASGAGPRDRSSLSGVADALLALSLDHPSRHDETGAGAAEMQAIASSFEQATAVIVVRRVASDDLLGIANLIAELLAELVDLFGSRGVLLLGQQKIEETSDDNAGDEGGLNELRMRKQHDAVPSFVARSLRPYYR